MASSSGNSISNSSGSSLPLQNSRSEHDLLHQRKRRRMESNRESARRSRVRKQKHLDDLMVQITELKNNNSQIQTSIGFTTQHYMNMEAENSILRAQMMELSQRLESLNEILDHINSPTASNGVYETEGIEIDFNPDCFTNPFNLPYYLNQQQPVMASPDISQY